MYLLAGLNKVEPWLEMGYVILSSNYIGTSRLDLSLAVLNIITVLMVRCPFVL